MEVWRLERRGYGPYSANVVPLDDYVQLPEIVDGIEDCGPFPDNWVFGCPSQEILEWMFGHTLPILLSKGFKIVKYEVYEGNYRIGKSGKQVVFKRTTKTDIVKKLAAELGMPLLEIKM